jgi:hypothetical protein
VTADRQGKIQERRIALLAKLRTLRSLQALYSPAVVAAVERDEARRDPEAAPVLVEKIRLYLPSDLTTHERTYGCQRGLPEMEARLREAQCHDALANIRTRLHAKRFLIAYRNSQVTGQGRATKSRTLIDQVSERVMASAEKYRDARKALHNLRGTDSCPEFKELKPEHLALDGEVEESDAQAWAKLRFIAAGKGKRTPRHVKGTSKKVMSWIWTSAGSFDSTEEELHDCKCLSLRDNPCITD